MYNTPDSSQTSQNGSRTRENLVPPRTPDSLCDVVTRKSLMTISKAPLAFLSSLLNPARRYVHFQCAKLGATAHRDPSSRRTPNGQVDPNRGKEKTRRTALSWSHQVRQLKVAAENAAADLRCSRRDQPFANAVAVELSRRAIVGAALHGVVGRGLVLWHCDCGTAFGRYDLAIIEYLHLETVRLNICRLPNIGYALLLHLDYVRVVDVIVAWVVPPFAFV